MAYVYIIYSGSTDKYYIGSTTEIIETRIERHNNGYYQNKYTESVKPWSLYYLIPGETIVQARRIETHVKSMKSRRDIENLKLIWKWQTNY